MNTRISFIVLGVLGLACASSPAPLQPASGSQAEPRPSTAASPDLAPSKVAIEPAAASEPAGPGVGLCDVVCELAYVEAASDNDGAEDVTRASENANKVLGGIRADLLACFENRIRAKPQTDPFMRLGIVVGPDGKVTKVVTSETRLVSPRAVRCLDNAVRRVSFDPPRGRGSMRIEVPFTLRKAGETD